MVFYFTGTGNSLYIAEHIENDPISIPQVIHEKNQVYFAESIGIVAPIYGHEVPQMVKDFLKKAEFHTDYFYMILTYGNRHGGAAELAQKLCQECGIHVNYINVIVMVDNWLPSFDMNEQKSIDKHIPQQFMAIIEDIRAKKNAISPVTDVDRAAHQQFLAGISKMPTDAWQHLICVTDACIGCGICEKVCPSASIRVINRKAVYTPGNCQTCLACAHACPKKAIQLTIPEKNPDARYRNEHISLQEIITANQQNKKENNMDRPYIICHILSALDGKISGAFMGTQTVQSAASEYGRIRSAYQAEAWLYGTTTTKEFTNYRKPVLKSVCGNLPEGDYVAETDLKFYYVSVDTMGEIGWESGTFRKTGRPDSHVIEILTEETPLAYRAYLREKGVSYIIAGSNSLDCKAATRKLKQLFKIDTVLICGGGIINWTFVQQGVVDELSLILAPAADGDPATPTVFEQSELLTYTVPVEFTLKNIEQLKDSGVRLNYLVRQIQEG